MQCRFHTVGFHEAYDKSKEERLQDGFQDGYQDVYETATRIGNLLGESIVQSELGELQRRQEPSHSQPAKNVGSSRGRLMASKTARMIRPFVLDPGSRGRLLELESQIKEMQLVVEPPTPP
jgi:hypothetical protein